MPKNSCCPWRPERRATGPTFSTPPASSPNLPCRPICSTLASRHLVCSLCRPPHRQIACLCQCQRIRLPVPRDRTVGGGAFTLLEMESSPSGRPPAPGGWWLHARPDSVAAARAHGPCGPCHGTRPVASPVAEMVTASDASHGKEPWNYAERIAPNPADILTFPRLCGIVRRSA